MTGTNTYLMPLIKDTYNLGELIGSGSFANVFIATHKESNSPVAIKSYKMKKYNIHGIFRAACEMAFVKILNHNNIIRFISCGTSKYCMYLVMEFAPNGSLLKYISAKETLSLNKVQLIMSQLLSALHYLHSLKILHGDVKPENILIIDMDTNVMIKLSDFGLAEILDESCRKTKNSGSILYMAPELLLNFPYDLTADLYSAGVVMYELIYGDKPIKKHPKLSHKTLLRKRIQIKFPPVDDLPPQCMDLLQSLLEYDKHKRPQGEKLLNDKFLQIKHTNYPTVDRYIISCDNFVKSYQYLNSDNWGQAYIEAVEGLLQLKIHTYYLKHDDELLCYLKQNLQRYSNYIHKLERKILTIDRSVAESSRTAEDERLRCMLASTPCLLNAYDMCLLGIMYVNQNNEEVGIRMLEEGVTIILDNMPAEPKGERRSLLLFKVNLWLRVLEQLKKIGRPVLPPIPRD